jgi:hypothetical protein
MHGLEKAWSNRIDGSQKALCVFRRLGRVTQNMVITALPPPPTSVLEEALAESTPGSAAIRRVSS